MADMKGIEFNHPDFPYGFQNIPWKKVKTQYSFELPPPDPEMQRKMRVADAILEARSPEKSVRSIRDAAVTKASSPVTRHNIRDYIEQAVDWSLGMQKYALRVLADEVERLGKENNDHAMVTDCQQAELKSLRKQCEELRQEAQRQRERAEQFERDKEVLFKQREDARKHPDGAVVERLRLDIQKLESVRLDQMEFIQQLRREVTLYKDENLALWNEQKRLAGLVDQLKSDTVPHYKTVVETALTKLADNL